MIFGQGIDNEGNTRLLSEVVKLAEQSPACSEGVEYVGLDEWTSRQGEPVFVAMCKHSGERLYYSRADIETGTGSGKITPICEDKAIHLCLEGLREALPEPDMLGNCTERTIKTTNSGTVLIEQLCNINNGKDETQTQMATMCALTANGALTIGFTMTAA